MSRKSKHEFAKNEDLEKTELILLAIVYPPLLSYITDILGLPKKKKRLLQHAISTSPRNINDIIAVLESINIHIEKEQISNVLSDKATRFELLLKFYKSYPKVMKKIRNRLFHQLQNQKGRLEHSELIIAMASIPGLIQNLSDLPKNILFAVANNDTDTFFKSLSIPTDLKLEYAVHVFKADEQSKKFIMDTLMDNPLILERFLCYILSESLDLIPYTINLGGNITRITLYAIANVANKQSWDEKRIIKTLKLYERTCPADLKSIIKLMDQKLSFMSALETVLGPIDSAVLNYQPSVPNVEFQNISPEDCTKVILSSDLLFIQELDSEKQINYFYHLINSLKPTAKNILLELVLQFNDLYDSFLKSVLPLLENADEGFKRGTARTVERMFSNTGHKGTLEVLRFLLNDSSWHVRLDAINAIKNIFRGTGHRICVSKHWK